MDKFYLCFIAQGVKVSKTALASLAYKVAINFTDLKLTLKYYSHCQCLSAMMLIRVSQLLSLKLHLLWLLGCCNNIYISLILLIAQRVKVSKTALASFAYKAAKKIQIRINLMVSSTLPAFFSNGKDVNFQINLFTHNFWH